MALNKRLVPVAALPRTRRPAAAAPAQAWRYVLPQREEASLMMEWQSMPPRILYEETSDEDMVRYAEYLIRNGEPACEILPPGSTRKHQLVDLLKQREISGLIVKWGVCWAEYKSIDGYNTHELLRYEDFDENTPYEVGEIKSLSGNLIPVMYGGNRLQRLEFDVKRGFIKGFEIKFGPKLPKDYYWNFDYSKYPGGYGPSQAYSGED